MSAYSEALAAAIAQARINLPLDVLVTRDGVPLKTGLRDNVQTAHECPGCGAKDKFSITLRDGHWSFRCFRASCSYHQDALPAGKDEIGWIAMRRGLSRNDAIDAYLADAGVDNPRDEFRNRDKTSGAKITTPEADSEPEEEPAPALPPLLTDFGDKPRTPHEAFWSRLTLTDRHRKELKQKRGLSDEAIDKLGFRSSLRSNRDTLTELIEEFSPKTLLEAGLAVYKRGTKQIIPAHSLCGMGINKNDEADFNVEPVVIFPDKDGIVWHNGEGYRFDENYLSFFVQKPPYLFPETTDQKLTAKEAYEAIDWEQERKEVSKLWDALREDFRCTYGSEDGYIALSITASFLAHPEIFERIGGKPSLWVQGRKGSGKTETTHLKMRMLAFPADYGSTVATGTKVGTERGFAQFCGIPVHLDEFRRSEVPPATVAIIRNAYNEQGQPKGMADGSKRTRSVRPLTPPIVTGEDSTDDTATISRFIKLVIAESDRIGTKKEQAERYQRMIDYSDQLYRIGRLLWKFRPEFARLTLESLTEWLASPSVQKRIPAARAKDVHGIAYGAYVAMHRTITGQDLPDEEHRKLANHLVKFASEASDEIEREVLLHQWLTDCVGLAQRGVNGSDKLIRVCQGWFNTDHRFQIGPDNATSDHTRWYVLIAYQELYSEYERDAASRRVTSSLSRPNIRAELRREPYWIPPHTSLRPRVHRVTIYAGQPRRNIWILDLAKMGEFGDTFEILKPDPDDESDPLGGF